MGTKELSVLELQECRELLARHHFGRLAYADRVGELPVIVPVNYVFTDGAVVLRTAPGSKLRAALDGAGAAFEIDGADEETRTGWSVLVRGRVESVTDPDQLKQLEQSPVETWAPGEKPHVIRLTPGKITGRRLSLADIPSTWWG